MIAPKMPSLDGGRPIALCAVLIMLTAVSAVTSDDPLQTLACGFGVALTVGLLWRFDEPPVLLLPAGLQIIQVVTPRFYANLTGVPIENVSLRIGDVTAATWLALAAIVGLVLGLWCGQLTRAFPAAGWALQREARSWSPRRAFVFCIVTIVLAAVFEVIGEISEGLRQPALAAGGIQWVGIFVLAAVCMAQRRGFNYLLIVTCLEVTKGFTGYFSDFRAVFFVLLIGLFSVRSRIRPGTVVAAAAVCIVLVLMGAWWSAIKKEYRSYLSQGLRQQVVVVPVEDRIAFLAKKLVEVDEKTIAEGLELLVQRVGYVDYLAATMRYVPSRLPYQDGAQVGGTIMHILQPRFLFPDKPPVPSDSEVLEKYTGARWGDSSGPGTSVSLGYVTELYVDFGPFGTVLGTFIIGLFVGRTYRYITSSKSLPSLMNYGLAVMMVMTMTQFEQALIKVVGALVMSVIVILLLRRFFLPYLLRVFGPARPSRMLPQPAE
jgi:hypothetical protein